MTTITLGSATNALKAKRLLQKMKIPSQLVKVDPKDSRGCTHGIEFPTAYFYTVISVLIKEDIKYTLYSQY